MTDTKSKEVHDKRDKSTKCRDQDLVPDIRLTSMSFS